MDNRDEPKEMSKELDIEIVPPHEEEQVEEQTTITSIPTVEAVSKEASATEATAPPRKKKKKKKAKSHSEESATPEYHKWKKMTQTANRFWGMLFNNTMDKGEMRFQKIDAKTVKQWFTGIAIANLLRRYWLVFLLILGAGSVNITLGYLCGKERQEIQKLGKRLTDIRYRSLEVSSEVREKSLGSHLERVLVDSTLKFSNEAPYQLLIEADETK